MSTQPVQTYNAERRASIFADAIVAMLLEVGGTGLNEALYNKGFYIGTTRLQGSLNDVIQELGYNG